MLCLGELREQVAQAVNAAVLTVSTRPELTDGADEPGAPSATTRRGAPSPRADEITSELEPVFL